MPAANAHMRAKQNRDHTMSHAINLIIYVIMTLVSVVMTVIGFIDSLLAGVMSSAGIPPNVQIILLAVVAVLLAVYAIRALGGIFAGLIILLLVLMLAQKIFPGLQMHQGHTPSWLNPPAQPHTNL